MTRDGTKRSGSKMVVLLGTDKWQKLYETSYVRKDLLPSIVLIVRTVAWSKVCLCLSDLIAIKLHRVILQIPISN